MLTDEEVERLIKAVKHFTDRARINFPDFGDYLEREATTVDGHERFLVDVNRKGQLKPTKCTFQERYAVTDIIFRLDIDGPPHENPDGVEVVCPHLHIYKEGYADKWAYPLDPNQFSDTTNLPKSFREFLTLCNIHDLPEIQASLT
jgi:hypothetical protein